MRQYLRQVRVEIEDSDHVVLVVEQLRVVFDLRSEKQSSASPSTVRIYNLSKASASHIAEPGQIVRVWAGYGDINASDPLFRGEARRVLQERNGLDRITTIVLGGSDSAMSGAIFTLSEEGPVGLREVIREIVNTMGLGLEAGSLDAVPDEALEDGYSFNGPAKTALTRLLEPRGITSYEVGGVMHFAAGEGGAVGGEFRLNRFTGLIGSPSVTENDGARAKMALNGSIELGQTVQISSEALDGWFEVRSIAHLGDNWGGEFVTEIEGKRVEPSLEGVSLLRDFTQGVA